MVPELIQWLIDVIKKKASFLYALQSLFRGVGPWMCLFVVTTLETAIPGITNRHKVLLKKSVLPPMCLSVLVRKTFPRTLLVESFSPFGLVIYPPSNQSLTKGNGSAMTAFSTNHNSPSGAREGSIFPEHIATRYLNKKSWDNEKE